MEHPRPCDICGATWTLSQLALRQGLFYCPDDNDRWTALEKNRVEKGARRPKVRGIKGGKVDEGKPLYIDADAAIMAKLELFVRDGRSVNLFGAPPSDGMSGSTASAEASGWAGIYLYHLYNDTTRPQAMRDRAKTLLASVCDWLAAHQYGGSGSGYGASSDSFFYGFIADTSSSSSGFAEEQWAGGLALLYGYRATGTTSYLDAAKRAGHAMRALQCPDKVASPPATVHDGGYCGGATLATAQPSALYEVNDIAGIWFMQELKTTAGDITVGYNGTTAEWLLNPSTLLSTSISEARAFWTNGVGGTVGFSATTPKDYFDATTGTRAWANYSGSNVAALSYAAALWGLYNYEGYTSQVSGVYAWLRAGASNSTYETSSSGVGNAVLYRAKTGTYDPNVALSGTVDANAKNQTSEYSVGSVGLLAAIQAARAPATLKSNKVTFATPRQKFYDGRPGDAVVARITHFVQMGLSYQIGSYTTCRVTAMCQAGLVWRQVV